MSKSDDRAIVSRLFIAVPELSLDFDFLDNLRRYNIIDDNAYQKFRDTARLTGRFKRVMRGRSLLGRISAVAPEMYSTQMVNFLRQFDLIGVEDAHKLRLIMRATGTVGKFDQLTAYERLIRMFDLATSNDAIGLAEAQKRLTHEQAEYLRGYIGSGRHIRESLPSLLRAKGWLARLLLFADVLVDPEMVRNMVRVGLITPQVAANVNEFIGFGKKEWRVFESARAAEGFHQRMVLMLTGSFNDELVDALFKHGIGGKKIPLKYRPFFQIMIEQSRQVNDLMLERLVKRRYRVQPGEDPLKTFRRASRATDKEILRLLARAARDAGKLAATLDVSKTGGAVRAAQLRATKASLHLKMHELWHGLGALTIMGEKEAAEAGAESVDALAGKILGKHMGQNARDAVLFQSKAGVDAYISRQENLLPLSRRIYRNRDLYIGNIDKRINIALLQGKSATEFAADMERFFKVGTPGGPHYAAMRLARTEINNAFHLFTIRSTREQPWVRGYHWHLSGSHPNSRQDQCNTYAETDQYDLGRGIFPKSAVPGKPHPNCLCYITVEQMDSNEFAAAMKAGRFDNYLDLMRRNNAAASGVDDTSFLAASAKYAGVRTAERAIPQVFRYGASSLLG